MYTAFSTPAAASARASSSTRRPPVPRAVLATALSTVSAAAVTLAVCGAVLVFSVLADHEGSGPATLLAAGGLWFAFAFSSGAFAPRHDGDRPVGALLVAGLLALGLGAVLDAFALITLRIDLIVLIAALTATHLVAWDLLRRLTSVIDPRRSIVIRHISDLHGTGTEQRDPRRLRVRGFAPEVLADPAFVLDAIRLDLRREQARRILVEPGVPAATIEVLSWELRKDGIELLLLPPVGPVRRSRARLLHTSHGPGLLLTPPVPGLIATASKRVFDVVAGLGLLLVLSPLMLVTALLIRREDGGPALFQQERIGRDGKPFTILKFRTMLMGADEKLADLLREQNAGDAPLFKVKDDPRLTRLGPFLRRTSIDELPQLLNVVGGSMSLVGPRPQRAAEVALYSGTDEHRLGVRPGLTGLWQVSGRSRLTWDEARGLDVYYAHNWSPALDALILLRTLKAVLTSDGAL